MEAVTACTPTMAAAGATPKRTGLSRSKLAVLPGALRARASRQVNARKLSGNTVVARAIDSPPGMGQGSDMKDFTMSFENTQGLFSYVPDNRPAMREPSTINVSEFIEKNFTAYDGDASFLAGPTEKTKKLWDIVQDLQMQEFRKGGLLDCDPNIPSTITSFPAGYIEPELDDVCVGLQTDKPLKRAIKPFGGIGMVNNALKAYDLPENKEVTRQFTEIRKTHNQGVFDAYTSDMRACRKSGILTGLPDGYGRGRIIGDYRRVALYGTDALVADKKHDLDVNLKAVMDEKTIQLREEVTDQMRALQDLKEMAATYGCDISRPAETGKEAVQWLYFGYLGAVKQQDGAAMSMGRVDAFLDIYFEKDLAEGRITEEEAQEVIDHFVMKLRIVKHLRTPDYNDLFAGDPTWVTCVLGGADSFTKGHRVTKTAYRILQTLYNLGPSPEPNITVLWHPDLLPEPFKEFAAKVSVETSSIQYENDLMMGQMFGSDYSIACCVSAMREGQDMQFFGARCNMPKLLLYILNQGRDEVSGSQVGPRFAPLEDPTAPLNYLEVMERLELGLDWLVKVYVDTMNVIHYMHDKYNYESLEMALHDTHVRRFLALGMSGIAVVADSLSAIKYAKVTPVLDDRGLMTDFNIEGEYPAYGNNDERVDSIARWVVESFTQRMRRQYCYRDSIPTLSLLTITSNVVYGRKTGSTPDGRKKGEPFAPGANPSYGRDTHGALASLASVAKMPYTECMDGVSNTFTLVPQVLGKSGLAERQTNLVSILDGYFASFGHHLNVNVLNRETLLDAVDNPEKYPNLTIRVSGYAVHFIRLTKEQQMDVIGRTFHGMM
uniref:formate C-acetyltransferase n=2 Tax=Eukaryota TaxID=2759 RepID=A0A7S1SIF9_9CHLO|mmetsp:Transcript_13517/g.23990  ORF Transcript_13517/g.23990 Transcript_13517/m.23990 type:complete len:833 (+) Transcript_13517:185-2683(+)|eukprot:CAMPEP_0177771196 /NCGR_PEP_ID=MMETSP0491_2-20121128/11422_1 /TAXON_ID=63592 /ORGANISM="Tetraselmis chuii, Strain PLY429" /LENGTH=832 /DNA_ID=CAMNT_0019288647 /DNA_START=272 /DNA_END=2770 /DNA_ORIENTATION=-